MFKLINLTEIGYERQASAYSGYILGASLKTRLIKEKTDRCGSCKETFRRRAAALRGRLTQQMSCIAVFSQKGFLEMPLNEYADVVDSP